MGKTRTRIWKKVSIHDEKILPVLASHDNRNAFPNEVGEGLCSLFRDINYINTVYRTPSGSAFILSHVSRKYETRKVFYPFILVGREYQLVRGCLTLTDAKRVAGLALDGGEVEWVGRPQSTGTQSETIPSS